MLFLTDVLCDYMCPNLGGLGQVEQALLQQVYLRDSIAWKATEVLGSQLDAEPQVHLHVHVQLLSAWFRYVQSQQ